MCVYIIFIYVFTHVYIFTISALATALKQANTREFAKYLTQVGSGLTRCIYIYIYMYIYIYLYLYLYRSIYI